MRSANLSRAARRVAIARAGLLLLFAALALRAAHLSVLDGRGARRIGEQLRATLRLPPERGSIFDRHGAELAVSVRAPSVYAIPGTMADAGADARALARALGLTPARVVQRLRHREGFVFVARWVAPERARQVLALELSSVGTVLEPRRVYPYGAFAGQLLGFANIDGDGVRGIEQLEDAWLRGRGRSYAVERDARGHLLAAPGVDPKQTVGGDLRLTIDAALQADAEDALDAAVAKTGAHGGIAITLDPRSGDVLAVAERPSFDPNEFRRTAYAETRSRAFLDAFEPGSTLKIFLVAGALDRGVLSAGDLIDCEGGAFRIPGKTIRDGHAHGLLDPAAVVRVSSNIGATKIAFLLGAAAHGEVLGRFGFGHATGSGFPSESTGLVRPAADWRPVDHASIAYGQGISVTPIQLAAATAALANGGVWRQPRLIAARRRAGGAWQRAPEQPAQQAVAPEVARDVLRMMEGVVGPGGTGRRAALRGVRVAGKTGTAQVLDAETGTYARDRYLAWFVGAVPADDPKLVILTELDEPQRGRTGGGAAAPFFAQLAAAQLARIGVTTMPQPEVLRARAVPKASATETLARSEPTRIRDARVLLPDFVGLTVNEAKRVAAANALRVELVGEGRAVEQEPHPGAILAGGTLVRIRFRRNGSES